MQKTISAHQVAESAHLGDVTGVMCRDHGGLHSSNAPDVVGSACHQNIKKSMFPRGIA